jgi:hypothetical protein
MVQLIGAGNVPSGHELVFGTNNSDITFLSANDDASVDGTIGAWNTTYNFQNSKIVFNKVTANTAELQFFTNAGSGITEHMRIHNNGVVSASAGVALGVGTANTASNVLDDYEEGTFTPTVTSATGTITTASATGIYTKVGRLVTVGINILITTNGTGAGNVIATLPFTVGSFIYYAHGRETAVSGFALTGTVSGTTVVLVKTSNDLYPGGDSHRLQASFTYSV